MSDLLVLFAALVVAPAGVVIALLVVFVVARDIRADWRREFPAPPVSAAHPPERVDSAVPALGRTGTAHLSSLPVSWR